MRIFFNPAMLSREMSFLGARDELAERELEKWQCRTNPRRAEWFRGARIEEAAARIESAL